METSQIVMSIITLLLSIGSFVISYRQAKEKGFVFNNAYLYASQKERETMDKKPAYKQSKIVFAFLGVIFLLLSLEIILDVGWLLGVVILLAVCVIVYAIVSTVRGELSKPK